jgi:hypothetical protein
MAINLKPISLAVVCMTLLLFSISTWPQLKVAHALQLSDQSAIKFLASSDPSAFFVPPSSSSISQSNATNSTTAAVSASNFLTYQNSTYGISVQHPSNWIKEENHNPTSTGRIVKFSSPVGTSQAGQFSPPASLNIIVGNRLPLSVSLEQFSAASTNNLRQSFPHFNLLESSSTTLGGFPAHKIVYTAIIPSSGLEVKFMQIFTIKDGKDFVITSAALPTDFSTYLPTFQKMIDSFAFIQVTTPAAIPSNAATPAAIPSNATTPTTHFALVPALK